MKSRMRRPQREKAYIDRPRRSRLPLYATGTILLAAFAVSLWSVAVIDCNSSQMGWNRRPTEFAATLSPTWDNLTVTAFGQTRRIFLGPAGRVRELPGLIGEANDYGQPALLREGRLLLRWGYGRSEFIRQAFRTLRQNE